MPRKRKDKNKPKGPCTSYHYFIKYCRAELNLYYPGVPVIFRDFSQYCSQRWRTVDPAQKKIYYEMSVIDRLRYLEEMKHYIPPPPPLLPPGVGKKAPSPTQPKKQVFATLTSIPTEGDAQFSIGSQSQHYSQETQNYSENSQQDSQQVQEVPQQGPEMSQNEQEEPPQDSQQGEDSSEEIDVGTEEDFSSLAIEKWW